MDWISCSFSFVCFGVGWGLSTQVSVEKDLIQPYKDHLCISCTSTSFKFPGKPDTRHSCPNSTKASAHPRTMLGIKWHERADMPRDAFQDTAYSTKSKPWVFIAQRALQEKKKLTLVVKHLETRTTSKAAEIKLYPFTMWTPHFTGPSPSCHFWFIAQLMSFPWTQKLE